MSAAQIPAIDLSAFTDGSSSSAEARAAAARELDAAAERIGFFYMRQPGLAEAAGRLLRRCVEFHAQPSDLKLAVRNTLSPLRRGYNVAWESGGGSCAARPHIDPPDPKETYQLGSEGDGISPMHRPNLWPSEDALPGWREAVEADWAAMLRGAKVLATALAAALGEPPSAFDEAMATPATVMVMLRYDATKLAEGSSTGCGAHTDCGFLTLLAQEEGGAPLQVQRGALTAGAADRSGATAVDSDAWVEAPPLAGHVLVNLGDMLARWTNGRYRSTVHRVMLQDTGESTTRHSVALFANPSYYSTVACFPSCCAPTPGRPAAQFEPLTAGKYISGRLGLMYKEKEDKEEKEVTVARAN